MKSMQLIQLIDEDQLWKQREGTRQMTRWGWRGWLCVGKVDTKRER